MVAQIDLRQRQPGQHRRRAAVHEERVVDHDGHGQREQPASVDAVRREHHAMTEVADRKALRRISRRSPDRSARSIRYASARARRRVPPPHRPRARPVPRRGRGRAGSSPRGCRVSRASCPPAAAASPCRRISRSITLRESLPRSSRSPVLTTCVRPPDQCSSPSTTPTALSSRVEVVVGAVDVGEGDHALDARVCHLRRLGRARGYPWRSSRRPRRARDHARDSPRVLAT